MRVVFHRFVFRMSIFWLEEKNSQKTLLFKVPRNVFLREGVEMDTSFL